MQYEDTVGEKGTGEVVSCNKLAYRCVIAKGSTSTAYAPRMKVPQNIKDQYKLPLPGYAQDSNIRPFRTQRNEGSNEEFLSQLVSLQTSVLRHQAKRKSKMDGEKSRKACKVEKEEGKGTGKAELHGSGVEQVGDAEKTNHLAEKTDSDINKNDCSSKLEEGTAVQSTSKDSPSDDETASNCRCVILQVPIQDITLRELDGVFSASIWKTSCPMARRMKTHLLLAH